MLSISSLSVRFAAQKPPESPPATTMQTTITTASGEQVALNHCSIFLRDPVCWVGLMRHLRDDFPNGVEIEVFAGSHGEDALSALVCTQAYFKRPYLYPISVSDMVPDNMNRGRLGWVNALAFKTEEAPSPSKDPAEWLRSAWAPIAEGLNLSKTSLERWVNVTPLLGVPRHLQTQLPQGRDVIRPIWRDALENEALFTLSPKLQAQLSHQVRFNPNPLNAVSALGIPPQNPTLPRVVLLRNMVYLLPDAERAQLLKNLRRNLPINSVLVLGHSENIPQQSSTGVFNSYIFAENLAKAGFEKQSDFIWRKTKK